MELNIANSIFEGLNDKGCLMICGYEWGEGKNIEEYSSESEVAFLDENALTTFSNKSPAIGDKAFKEPYDNNVIKWFSLWGHPLSRDGLGGKFEKSIVQTNWCNTKANAMSGDYYQKLTSQDQLDNFIGHIAALEPALIFFMGSEMINILQSKVVMERFMEVMGQKESERILVQKPSAGTRFKITFQNFERCKVVCLPHASGAHGVRDDYISLFRPEIGGLIAEYKRKKGI